ncbi:hypothetical protein PR202_ga29078 [Eleusine coracana subsp. coracana]|uniref:Uncharacterized protein n=1 Tax=Eleusine coracana subsp. coracana TaxID=191504 RepID=A0AAV5DM02_ELECO|nr:hypothetical protein PR202_ga29078 [Eleusine coracana subsp. coracana]
MKLLYWYLAAVLDIVFSCGLHNHTASDTFSSVVASLQWPGSYCDTRADRCCYPGNQKPAADFTIHGLWPNYADCRRGLVTPDATTRCWPDYCNATDPLNTSLIKDLEGDLLRNWGTLSCRHRNATAFWSHEWRRHGTCSGMDQHAYFRAALDFKARFNLTHILADAGVAPSTNQTYLLSSIEDAVTKATGSAPSVECNRNGRDEMQLYQVFQCVGRDGKSPVHCPRRLESRCPDKVKFPAF